MHLRVFLVLFVVGCGSVKSTQDAATTGGTDAPGSDAIVDAGCAAAEDCFNGVDDDCNDAVDCADTACTGSTTPVAECVADPGGAAAGIVETTACPTEYPTSTQLFAGLRTGTCSNGTCSCSGFTGGVRCDATLYRQGATQLSCSNLGTLVFQNATAGSGCLPFTALGTGYHTLSTTLVGQCNAPVGASAKVAPSWATTNNFCTGAGKGGGCPTGQVCMRAAPKHCVVENGSQTACTRPGYTVQDTTEYFTGFDDSARTCSCACTATGTCSVGFGVGGCLSTVSVATGCRNVYSGYDHAQVGNPVGAACTVGGNSNGATSTTGFERTVCCTK